MEITYRLGPIVTRVVLQDTPSARFVNASGGLGGASAISLVSRKAKEECTLLLQGESFVEVASGQTIAADDLLMGDSEGKATKVASSPAVPSRGVALAKGAPFVRDSRTLVGVLIK